MSENIDAGEGPGPMPTTPEELHQWLWRVLGIRVPRRAFVDNHASPFDYLCWSFFGALRPPTADDPADCVVWACRGGGKTFLGAVATLLDLVYRPGIEIRVLGGSMDQSKRMYAHLRRLLDPGARPGLAALVRGRPTERRVVMKNGAEVELLSQSQTSVRGTRVQKLRCDEVDLFDPEVFEAAQLTTRSATLTLEGGARAHVRGSIECLSTMHLSHGVMRRLVQEAREGRRRLFRWSVVDVLEHCPPERQCQAAPADTPRADAPAASAGEANAGPAAPAQGCALWNECRGRAKTRPAEKAGHVSVDDALSLKGRVPLSVWDSEMLCRRPSRTDAVLPEFSRGVHVFGRADEPAMLDPAARLLREDPGARWMVGMDFGIRTSVVLWGAVDAHGVIRVLDERHVQDATLGDNLNAVVSGLAREGVPPWPRPAWIAIDPAGEARCHQTGESDANVLRKAGFVLSVIRDRVIHGHQGIRARLGAADGSPPRLYVHARCVKLIESMERFRYVPGTDVPEKGEWDHAVDALRYLVLSVDRPRAATRRAYAGEG
jgi:hypothetical protein